MKKKFLIDQAIVNSIGGAFQHAGVYAKGIEDNDKRKDALRKDLIESLRAFEVVYVKSVDEDTHSQNIVRLAANLTENHKNSGILRDQRFRIGIAQKALNLYLKYMWCLGEIESPPHCPLDRRIIEKLDLSWGEREKYTWTKLNDIEDYKYLIEKCRKRAKENGNLSLADWELSVWSF